MVTISCACGETHFEVPCGTEMDQKPPKCPKQCPVSPLCNHRLSQKPHKCHYGACPPCRRICEEEYSCGHKCQLRCHGPKPPPKPEFTLKPKKKKVFHPEEPAPGSLCPPCPELVWRPCVGQHIGAERMMVCSNSTQFSCDNLCGNPLPCTNHYCTKICHALKSQHPSSSLQGLSEPCEKCNLPCEKERKPKCSHSCPLKCHPGDCPPCKVLLKRSCHCGSMVHVFECVYYISLSPEEQMAVRSCGGPCHRKLPYCTHLCPETCHPGDCPSPENCSKKVKELDTKKQVSKRKRRRDSVQQVKQISRLQKFFTASKYILLIIVVLIAVVSISLYGYKGLLWLNDWMNEAEKQRPRRRYPRI